jgi:hypothetical protein
MGARAAATVGLCVITVAARSGGSACTTASVVVPPSRITVLPGRIRAAAISATRRLLRGSTDWPIFRAGHVPMIGEWVALPVLRGAGGTKITDPVAAEIMYPTAERLLAHCDAVLRLPGASTGADRDVAVAERRGLPVYRRITDIPGVDVTHAK